MGEAIINLKTKQKKWRDAPINQMLSVNFILTQRISCKKSYLKNNNKEKDSVLDNKRLGLIL